jgi:hypothetical protein
MCIQRNIDKLGDKKLIVKWRSIIDKHILEENIKFSCVLNNPDLNMGNVNMKSNEYNNKVIDYNFENNIDVIININNKNSN